ncbi:MAG TPA: LytTR family DNA-binding domain-containing protein [Bacteroidales bacterium]|nr:LytTR family DNA-binding domain-containing protein [Bacteroidales bacterium]
MNNKMNCIAIDDEPLALDVISEFCSKISYLNLKGTYTNPFDAVQLLNSGKVDLLFLDIQMPQITGLEFLKSLYNPPMVIFTTAFIEYASQGFDYDAVDYLVKPFAFDRFTKSVNKAYQLMKLKDTGENQNETRQEVTLGFLMVKVEYSTIRVNLNDILYIEGLKDYVKIYSGSKPLITKTTMKNIVEKLPADRFIRVHKSYIVSVDKINMIENSRIVIGNQRIPIGESFRVAFFNIINRNLI